MQAALESVHSKGALPTDAGKDLHHAKMLSYILAQAVPTRPDLA